MSDSEARNPQIDEAAPAEEGMLEEPEGETEADHDAVMEEYLSNLHEAREGEIRTASVVEVGPDFVLVNLDDKSEGVAPLRDFIDSSGEVKVAVGDRVDVLIEEREADGGQIAVSHEKARRSLALQRLEKAEAENTAVSGTVTQAVKSGLLVDCGIECFMPASQIDLRRVEKLEDWVGQTVSFHVLEMNRRRGRAVVSRRKALEVAQERSRTELMARLKVGDTVLCTVKTVLGFGAFVDLNGVEAFIPREEISWEKAAAPVDYLRPGNAVQAEVMRMNAENGKITLSRRRMTPDPWAQVEQKYPKGSIVTGEVTGLTNFGAFVRLEEGLTGLIHVSDLSWSSAPTRPEDMLKEGDRVQAAVLDIDTARQRLSLGLKQISEDPWLEAEKRYPPKSKVRGVVSGVTRFGAFVRLEQNIEGLIHVSDFSWSKTTSSPAEAVKVGDEVEALVLKTDKSSRRISLGIKQLTPSPLERFAAEHRAGSTVEGKVVNIIESGVFLELVPDIDGFVPISHLAEEKVKKAGDVCQVGETMMVKILKMDVAGNRISLSRKACLQDEERARVAAYLKDDEAKGGLNLGELLQDLSLPRPE